MSFVNTTTCSDKTGVSRYALIKGYKEGWLPALKIGGAGRGARLLWDLDAVRFAMIKRMEDEQAQRQQVAG